MRKLLAAFIISLGLANAALAQRVTNPQPNAGVYGAYLATPPTCVNGSGCWFQTDINGNLKVAIAAGGGSGGTASTFGAAFPATGTAVGMSQGGNMVAMNGLAGNLLVNCAVGCSGGTFNNNSDNVATSATNGQAAAWGYLWDGAAWDRAPGNSTTGALVTVANTLAAVANTADGVAGSAGAASPVANYGFLWNGATWDRQRSVGATGSTSVTNPAADPCQTQVNLGVTVNISTATTTRLVAPVTSLRTYICSVDLFAFAANNVAIVEGTGGTCVTGIAGVVGGTTTATGISFPTQGGLAKGGAGSWVWRTAGTNVDFCLITSTTGPLTGYVKYVQAP